MSQRRAKNCGNCKYWTGGLPTGLQFKCKAISKQWEPGLIAAPILQNGGDGLCGLYTKKEFYCNLHERKVEGV